MPKERRQSQRVCFTRHSFPLIKEAHMHPLIGFPGYRDGLHDVDTIALAAPRALADPLSLCVCLALALSPSLADARAAAPIPAAANRPSSSQGSRGTRTNENNNARRSPAA